MVVFVAGVSAAALPATLPSLEELAYNYGTVRCSRHLASVASALALLVLPVPSRPCALLGVGDQPPLDQLFFLVVG